MKRFDSSINDKNTCEKLIRFKNADFKDQNGVEVIEKVTWGKLSLGDIVLLHKEEYCPADILILDMWDNKCIAKTSFIDD